MNQKRDRLAAEKWAQGLLQRDDWCILDTETTGLLKTIPQACQIAVISGTGETLLNSLVKPTKPIGAGATRAHGIADDMVAQAPGFPDLYPLIVDCFRDREVIIYNSAFDIQVVRNCCFAHDLPEIFTDEQRVSCAMRWYAQWVGDWSDTHGSYKFKKLPGGDHTALGDCLATLATIKKMAG